MGRASSDTRAMRENFQATIYKSFQKFDGNMVQHQFLQHRKTEVSFDHDKDIVNKTVYESVYDVYGDEFFLATIEPAYEDSDPIFDVGDDADPIFDRYDEDEHFGDVVVSNTHLTVLGFEDRTEEDQVFVVGDNEDSTDDLYSTKTISILSEFKR